MSFHGIQWSVYPYSLRLFRWHCGNLVCKCNSANDLILKLWEPSTRSQYKKPKQQPRVYFLPYHWKQSWCQLCRPWWHGGHRCDLPERTRGRPWNSSHWKMLIWKFYPSCYTKFHESHVIIMKYAHFKNNTSVMEAIFWSLIFNAIERNKQRVLMHGHQGWNVRHGLCHIYMRYVYNIYELFIAFVSFVVCSLL